MAAALAELIRSEQQHVASTPVKRERDDADHDVPAAKQQRVESQSAVPNLADGLASLLQSPAHSGLAAAVANLLGPKTEAVDRSVPQDRVPAASDEHNPANAPAPAPAVAAATHPPAAAAPPPAAVGVTPPGQNDAAFGVIDALPNSGQDAPAPGPHDGDAMPTIRISI